jgi:hypothetical protein
MISQKNENPWFEKQKQSRRINENNNSRTIKFAIYKCKFFIHEVTLVRT